MARFGTMSPREQACPANPPRLQDPTRLRAAEEAGRAPTDEVGVGSTVTLRFGDDTVESIRIGEPAEASDQALVTADSPLGRALLGHRAGDTVR